MRHISHTKKSRKNRYKGSRRNDVLYLYRRKKD